MIDVKGVEFRVVLIPIGAFSLEIVYLKREVKGLGT
jgi:hypothetical protein